MKPVILLFLVLFLLVGSTLPALAQGENVQVPVATDNQSQPAGDTSMDAFWTGLQFAWLLILAALILVFYTSRRRKQKMLAPGEKPRGEEKEPLLSKFQLTAAKLLLVALAAALGFLLLGQYWLYAAITLGVVVTLYLTYPGALAEIWQSVFKKEKAASVITETSTTFNDVGGLDEEIEELKYVVYLYKNPKEAEELDIQPTKGILLVGPPGCGKTLLGKAMAGSAGLKFLYKIAAEIGNSYVRSGAQGVKDLFNEARAQAPCILFLDEFDALARRRGYDASGEFDHALTAFLAEMDGLVGLAGVLVIAASNREDILDEAATRPGRFDKKIIISLPDENGRGAILKIHSAKKKPAKDVDFELLAKRTPGFSGAALRQLCNEAAQFAHKRHIKAKEEKSKIAQVLESVKDIFVEPKTTMDDFEAARDKVLMGMEKNLIMSDKERRVVAYHEIGHAVVTAEKGLVILEKVTLTPRSWGSLGATSVRGLETILPSKALLMARIVTGLGGRAAEEVFFGKDGITTSAHDDFERAEELARLMVCEYGMSDMGSTFFFKLGPHSNQRMYVSEETRARIDREVEKIKSACFAEATRIIQEKEEAVRYLAQLLYEKGAIQGKEIADILKDWPNIKTS